MDSSNLVALASVIVTGLGAPMFALATVRWQTQQTSREVLAADRQRVLDEAASALARFMRANGRFLASWRHGAESDSELEALLEARSSAQDSFLSAYAGIGMRFGTRSGAYEACRKVNDTIIHFNSLIFPFFKRQRPLGDDSQFDRAFEDLEQARMDFLEAGFRVINSRFNKGPHTIPASTGV
jgi:hypothetical protein